MRRKTKTLRRNRVENREEVDKIMMMMESGRNDKRHVTRPLWLILYLLDSYQRFFLLLDVDPT